jgi:hypothetical protein
MSRTIGSTKLWLPSRRSVASQRGGLSIVLFGHVRSGKFNGLNRLYFLEGSLSLQDTRSSELNPTHWWEDAESIVHRHSDCEQPKRGGSEIKR